MKTFRKIISNIWYWIRCHTYNKYHILNLKNKRTDDFAYKWGWMDRDHLMYLACFKILEEFVEKEDPNVGLSGIEAYKSPDREWYESEQETVQRQVDLEKEVRSLYNWWKYERPKEYEEVQNLMNNIPYDDNIENKGWLSQFSGPQWKEYYKRTEELDNKDDEMLIRLMRIRRTLWT